MLAGGAELPEAASAAAAASAKDAEAQDQERLQILAVQDAQSTVYLMTSGGFQLARMQTSLPVPCSMVRLFSNFSSYCSGWV